MENSKKHRPPRFASFILARLLLNCIREGAIGDFEEQYDRIVKDKNRVVGWIWYGAQILQILPVAVLHSLQWSLSMIKNYLIVAFRNIKRQKVFSIINILGLSVGMAGFIIFALVAGTKLNADLFHTNLDRIFSVVQVISEAYDEEHTAYVPAPLLPELRAVFPEIENSTRIIPAGQVIIKHDQNSFYENRALFVEPEFLDIFSFELIVGNKNTALADPFSIVLSEAAAQKYFGHENPIGQTLTLNKSVDVRVTGITKNMPRTSSIRFEFLVSLETARKLAIPMKSWAENQVVSFLLLKNSEDRDKVESQLLDVVSEHFADPNTKPQKMYLFPMRDIRLKSSHITSFWSSSIKESVVIIFAFGALLLIIVCINFINLSTARFMHRTKEIGMRKVVGARRPHLINQFLFESVLMAIIAIPIAVILYELAHPIVSKYYLHGSSITFVSHVSNSFANYPFLFKYLLIAAVITGLLSGFYPALFLSSYQPAQILKGSHQSEKYKRRGSKIMIVVQFSLSIIFIMMAGIIKNQFQHFLKADFGYSREQVAFIRLSDEMRENRETLTVELRRHPNVLSVTAAEQLPILWETERKIRPLEMSEEEAFSIKAYGVDYGFIETLDMNLKKGRNFERITGSKKSYILNERAVQNLNLDEPIGKQLIVGEETGTVIGVVEDFLFADVGFSIPSAVLYIEPEKLNYLLIKYASSDQYSEFYDYAKEKWQLFAPDLPFECLTLDDYLNDIFDPLDSMASLFNIIGIIAVFFSCLGLLGLASFFIKRRTKEIGIRKVLGASVFNVLWNVNKGYLLLVVISNFISILLVYFGWEMVQSTGLLFIEDISTSLYVFAISLSLLSAVVAVVSQTYKAAKAKPVDALRYE